MRSRVSRGRIWHGIRLYTSREGSSEAQDITKQPLVVPGAVSANPADGKHTIEPLLAGSGRKRGSA